MDKKDRLKQIPLELVKALYTSHTKKRKLTDGSPVKLQQTTKDVLFHMKKANGYRSVSDLIDALIAETSLTQINEADDITKLEEFDKDMKIDLKYNQGSTRHVIVDGREFYSLGSVTRMYKITRQTVINRIKDTKNKRWRNWNYADEDIEYKYSDKRVDKE